MKYVLIPFIALGFVLSGLIGINYHCDGTEMFPTYYGSPFIFKQKSLGSSLTYFYSVSGILLNVLVWSVPLIFLRLGILYLIGKGKYPKIGKTLYTGAIIFLVFCSSLVVFITYEMMGRGFGKGRNDWYMNLDQEAEDWGMTCEGAWGSFKDGY